MINDARFLDNLRLTLDSRNISKNKIFMVHRITGIPMQVTIAIHSFESKLINN